MSPRTPGDHARSTAGLVRQTLLGERDRPLLVLVTGAAGTGKTTRTAELVALAREARVSCVDLSFTSAHSPLVRSAVGVGPPPDPAKRDDAGAWRERLAREVPALLVVEDVQRAPAGFVALVRDWVERAGSGCVTVVTARPEELADPDLPLGPGLALPATLSIRHERTAPWTAGRVQELVHARLGPERGPRQVVARMAQLSGGNVQVVADLLELLGAAGPGDEPFTTQDVDALGVPARLAQLTATRLAALSPPGRMLVAAAAVLGGPAAVEDLATVAGLSVEDAEAALAEAGSLLVEDPRGDHGFAVPLAAAAVRARLPGPRRRRLHLLAADVLCHRDPVPWVHVAEHRRRGGATGDWLRAVEHVAGDAGAFADPDSVVDAVRPVLASPVIGEDVRARLALRLSRNAILTLPSPRTVAVLREIVGLPGLTPGVRGEIRLELGVLLHKQLNRAEGWAELEQAAGELRERPALLVRAMTALANPFQPGAGLAEHESWLVRAEQVADDDVSRAAVAAARTSLAVACGEAVPLRRMQPPRAGLELRHNEYLARGLTNTAVGALFAGRFAAAGEILDQARRCENVLGSPFFEQCDRGTRLLYDFERGAWDGLAERCRRGMSDAGIHSDARLVLVQLAVARGDWAEAEDVWPGRGGFAFVPYDAAAAATRARMALAQGRVEDAVTTVEEAWESLAEKGIWVWAARLAPVAAQTWLAAAAPGRAAEAATQFAAGLRGRNSPMAAAALRWTRALLAGGEPAAFEHASALYARLAAPYPAALALEGAAGPQHLETALEMFTRLGAAWDATRVRSRLRSLAGGAEPLRGRGRPAYDDALSPREREVAELASGGMTNRAIAETLHLSPRTVEHHISRAMQKAGTRSRRALLAALRA